MPADRRSASQTNHGFSCKTYTRQSQPIFLIYYSKPKNSIDNNNQLSEETNSNLTSSIAQYLPLDVGFSSTSQKNSNRMLPQKPLTKRCKSLDLTYELIASNPGAIGNKSPAKPKTKLMNQALAVRSRITSSHKGPIKTKNIESNDVMSEKKNDEDLNQPIQNNSPKIIRKKKARPPKHKERNSQLQKECRDESDPSDWFFEDLKFLDSICSLRSPSLTSRRNAVRFKRNHNLKESLNPKSLFYLSQNYLAPRSDEHQKNLNGRKIRVFELAQSIDSNELDNTPASSSFETGISPDITESSEESNLTQNGHSSQKVPTICINIKSIVTEIEYSEPVRAENHSGPPFRL